MSPPVQALSEIKAFDTAERGNANAAQDAGSTSSTSEDESSASTYTHKRSRGVCGTKLKTTEKSQLVISSSESESSDNDLLPAFVPASRGNVRKLNPLDFAAVLTAAFCVTFDRRE